MSEWRTGRKVFRTIYQDDELIGVMDTAELAEKVVRAVTLMQQSPEEVATVEELRTQVEILKRDHEADMETARQLNGQANRLIHGEGRAVIAKSKRIAELIEREAETQIGSAVAHGLRMAAEIARRA